MVMFLISVILFEKTLITFYRFASCPFCNLSLNEFCLRYKELDKNFRVVAIFNAPLDFLTKSTKKHSAPFPILADEKVYYGSNTTDHLKFDDIKTFSLS